MSATTLPVEVWAIIIKRLDTKSICNLYDTCTYLRNVICMHGVVKECQFSLNTLATAKSLKLDFFRDVSGCLKILNLSGVQDLTKSSLIPALKKLINLSDLNVSYTRIIMPDFLDIARVTPSLKNIAINFLFGKKYKVTKKLLADYQQAFGGMTDVHFVGSISDLLFGRLVVHILRKAKLLGLNFTVCGDYYQVQNYDGDDWDTGELPKLSLFRVYFIKEVLDQQLIDLPIFKSLDLNQYEIVIFHVCMTGVVTVFATDVLQQFICANFNIEAEPLSQLFPVVVGEAAVFLWAKDSTKFDSTFYSTFLIIFKEYLIFNFDGSSLVPVPVKYKWYYIKQSTQTERRNDSVDLKSKKARMAQSSFVINYDEAFKEKKDDIKLIINFTESITKTVTLNNCDFLRKLSHLVLIGDIRYSQQFFNVLFEYCECLDTLQVMKYLGTMSNIKLLQHLHKSKSLRNILVHVSGLIVTLFKYLSESKTLENIHLVNSKSLSESLPDPSDLFKSCDNLYNLCIKSNDPNLDKNLRMYKKVRSKLGKDFINIDMFPYSVRNNRYTPYFSAFNIYLKPLPV